MVLWRLMCFPDASPSAVSLLLPRCCAAVRGGPCGIGHGMGTRRAMRTALHPGVAADTMRRVREGGYGPCWPSAAVAEALCVLALARIVRTHGRVREGAYQVDVCSRRALRCIPRCGQWRLSILARA
eukprot:TRINITY_DN23196_c0_g1_i1.p2 TRINITY_DN23196_c0_g1~~TRINITY_DN23196_c0_g1_i1.p2  ORF type:complete len:127 (-),score=1.34 TRINITY_DN23196_c0_g1_i1:8-388(-)